MKRAELLKHATCNLCSKPIGNSGLPLFWTVSINRYGIDMQAAKRSDALGTYLGSQAIANIMGPDEDLAEPVMEAPVELTVCEKCACDRGLPIAAMAEHGRKEEVPA